MEVNHITYVVSIPVANFTLAFIYFKNSVNISFLVTFSLTFFCFLACSMTGGVPVLPEAPWEWPGVLTAGCLRQQGLLAEKRLRLHQANPSRPTGHRAPPDLVPDAQETPERQQRKRGPARAVPSEHQRAHRQPALRWGGEEGGGVRQDLPAAGVLRPGAVLELPADPPALHPPRHPDPRRRRQLQRGAGDGGGDGAEAGLPDGGAGQAAAGGGRVRGAGGSG